MKIKNIILSTAVLSNLLLASCTGSFLDEDRNPNSLSPNIFWKSEADIMKGLTSAYAYMQPNVDWAIPYERYIVIDNYRSDEIDFRADVSSWMSIAMFTNDPTNSVTETEWTNLYTGINYANQCIDNIPNVPDDDSKLGDVKKQALAEARFLRAYYYYRLYLNFGENVPIYTHELKGTDEEFYPKQATSGELVSFIESELKDIQSDLPEKYTSESDGGRITRYAAAAVLGKFYMFRHETAKAEQEFKKLIGKYELMDNYADNFDGLHKNNKESVLEVQFTGNMTGGHYEYNLFAIHLAPFSAYDGGYEEAYPSNWLFDLMKTDKTVDGKYSPRTLATIIFDDPDCRPSYYEDGKSFSDYHEPGQFFWHKYVTWDKSLSSDWYYSGYNVTLIRYADILLLYAECLNDRGATSEAIQYINQVRNRVNVPKLPVSMSKDQVLKHLQDVERPCELALEGDRWYDLIRWNIVGTTLTSHKKPYVENYVDSKHKLFPIPHKEFLMNPTWEQNPNFSK
jgi:hypothetical protein